MSDRATHIRNMHHYAFRPGQWAELLTEVESYGRPCYLVRFPDGKTDWWVKDDLDAAFEFAEFPAPASVVPRPDEEGG